MLDGEDVIAEVHAVLDAMANSPMPCDRAAATGATGKKITDIVNIGIGGSDLGPAMATLALAPWHDGPRAHFVSNVDGAHIHDTLKGLDPATTLFIIASKTFTTVETMTNAETARRWIEAALGKAATAKHFAAVSTALDKVAEFGIAPDRVFGFWDWVGGRYSLWGAIGLPIMIAVGPENFRAFLAGAHAMDEHFRTRAAGRQHAGSASAWSATGTASICGYPARAVIPYDQRLSRFPAYLQQLDMESNGKSVTLDGTAATTPTGPLVWGEPGTNGQHAFFQLLHQGTDVIPVEFLAAAVGHEPELRHHHDLLLANCLAQSAALMKGRTLEEARAQMLAKGDGQRGSRQDRAAPGVYRQPAVGDADLQDARSLHVRQADRALRAPRLRRRRAVRHQFLRPVGRRTWQGTCHRPAARGRGQREPRTKATPRQPALCAISMACAAE